MTSGKSSLNQRLLDTRIINMAEIEDRDYFVMGRNVFNRSNFKLLLEHLKWPKEHQEKALQWKSQIDPFWIDQLREGWKQWKIVLNRERKIIEECPTPYLVLFYNQSSPYCFHFEYKNIVVHCLAKSKEHAIKHANKVCTQQFLHKGWLQQINDYDSF